MRIVLAALALTVVAAAAAKGPDHASICGASRCIAVNGDIQVYALTPWKGEPFQTRAPPKPAPYYRITLRGWGEILYVPGRKVMRIWQGPHAYGNFAPGSSSAPYWRALPGYVRVEYAKLVRDLPPRPAPSAWP